MFGIDSPELLVILVVALVVIGPKELPGLLKTWGKWMATMRGMASEFRGHVDEMVRQSELDEVKKQLTDSTGGLDFKSLDPTKEMRSMIQDGVAEGEKALAEGKSSLENPLADNPSLDNPPLDNPPLDNPPLDNPPLDNPLAEPESAPQIAAEAAPEPAPESPAATPAVLAEPAPPAAAPSHEDKPKAAAAG